MRKVHVTLVDGRPDIVFVIGIEVRRGRGKYRNTTIITIAPRFQLYNRSSYQLLFAQTCFATNTVSFLLQKDIFFLLKQYLHLFSESNKNLVEYMTDSGTQLADMRFNF